MCHEPELIAQATLLPIDAYGMDAAILFSDILMIPEAMGVGLQFGEQTGPLIERPLLRADDVDRLPFPGDLSELDFVSQGIKLLKSRLTVPLIGFCGAPFTVASYMIEGKSSRDLKKTKQWMYRDPASFHSLLAKIADWSIAYLKLQVASGVDAVQIFDSWANYLAHHQFREFSLAYLQRILNGIASTGVPAILFCRGSSVFAPQLAELHPAVIGLDSNCRAAAMRQVIPSTIALQGNLDPDILYAPLSKIKSEVNQLLDEMEGDRGFILNLGHGVAPDVPEEAVRALVNCVKMRAAPCPAASSS